MDGSGRDLFQGIIPELAWRDYGKPRKTSVEIVGGAVEIRKDTSRIQIRSLIACKLYCCGGATRIHDPPQRKLLFPITNRANIWKVRCENLKRVPNPHNGIWSRKRGSQQLSPWPGSMMKLHLAPATQFTAWVPVKVNSGDCCVHLLCICSPVVYCCDIMCYMHYVYYMHCVCIYSPLLNIFKGLYNKLLVS
jgi:hypothetical protein